jgi:spermidine/putrescine transport system substrate-binding protein
MNFVYRPDVAAMIADWVWHVCPVPDAQAIIENDLGHPDIANSPLVFPDAELIRPNKDGEGDEGRLRTYRVFEEVAERREWEAVFGDVPS